MNYLDDHFVYSLEPDTSVDITTPLLLDVSSGHHRFQVLPLVRKGTRENLILDVVLKRATDVRIGWLIPANALSSNEHDFAENPHFLRYAFAAIREVLLSHQDLFTGALRNLVSNGTRAVPFAELFHDNVNFLVVCLDLADGDLPFDINVVVPTLVSYGYVPMSHCAPELVDWTCQELEVGARTMKIAPTGIGLQRPELPAKLYSIAASNHGSVITRFFYLYQVVELLLEEILSASLITIGRSVTASIEAEQYLSLRDHLEGLSSQLSEKARLSTLMSSFDGGDRAVASLAAASDLFLRQVGVDTRPGIGGLYQVRNFVVHQVRHMGDEAEVALGEVVEELAIFLPAVLASFRKPIPQTAVA